MSSNTNPYIGTIGGVYGSGGFGAVTPTPAPGPGFVGSGVVNTNYVFANGSNGISAVDISSSVTKINTPLLVNGRDVMAELDEIRDVLLLLRRDVDMEAKYPKLKQLADEYRLQLEKYKTFELIKESA